MPVVGLVITLPTPGATTAACEPDPGDHARLLAHVARLPGVTLGPHQAGRVALVLESDSAEQGDLRMTALTDALGDALIEVVFADFSDVDHVRRGAPYLHRARAARRYLEVVP